MGKIIQNSDGSKLIEEENRKLTKMVSTIIGIFLLCNSPKIPFFIFANYHPSHGSVWQAITQITGQEISEGKCGVFNSPEKPMEEIPNFYFCIKKLVESKKKGTLLYSSAQCIRIAIMIRKFKKGKFLKFEKKFALACW